MSEEEVRQMFYSEDGTCLVQNSEVTNVSISENGSVQVTLTEKNTKGVFSITYNPNETENMENIFALKVGDGGYTDVGKDFEQYALEQNTGYVAVTFHDPYSNINDSVKDALEVVSDHYDIEYQHMVAAGASAGADKTVALAVNYQDIVDNPVDIMLIDAANDAGDFINKALKTNEFEEFNSNGGTIYAYEAEKFSSNSGSNVSLSRPNYVKMIEAGADLVLIENRSANYHMAPYAINVKSGEATNIINGFNPEYLVRDTSDIGCTFSAFEDYNKRVDGNIYEVYYDGEWHEISTDDIYAYQTSSLREVKVRYGGLTNISAINLNGSTNLDVPIKTEYSSAVDSTNNIIGAIKGTSFLSENFDYQLSQNGTQFISGLYNSNSYLYGITGNLLGNLASETASIETIIRRYSSMENELAIQAENLGCVITNNPLLNPDFYNNYTLDINESYFDMFLPNLSPGSVGKINVSDFDSIYSNGSLIGPVAQGLQNEIQDATALKELINVFIDNNCMSGPGWDSIKNHISTYTTYCDLRIKAAEKLQEAYIKAIKMIKEYLYPYEGLDDSKIEELELEHTKLLKVIEDLKFKAERCVYVTQYDAWDKEKKYGYQVKTYPNKHLLDRVPFYQEKADEIKEMIDKLNGLAGVMNEANKIVQDAMFEITKEYAAPIDNITPILINNNFTVA